MKTKIISTITAIFALSTMFVGTALADGNAKMMLEADTDTVTAGETFTVQVLLDTDGVSVDEVDVKLSYDSEKLEIQDGMDDLEGDQFNEEESLLEVYVQNTIDAENGEVFFEQASLDPEQYYTTDGEPGVLVEFTVRALRSGTHTIELVMETGENNDDSSVLDAETGDDVLAEVTNLEITVEDSDTEVEETEETEEVEEPEAMVTTITLSSDKESVKAGSDETVQMSVAVFDQNGNPMPNTNIAYSVTLGTVSEASGVTDAEGKSTFMVTPGSEEGSMQVRVVAEDNASAQAVKAIMIEPAPAEVTVESVDDPEIGGPEENVSSGPDELDSVGPESMVFLLAIGLALLFQGVRTVNAKN